ncbi:hypothetical protein KIW84_032205 [Lathyrus oleraceus]|uniref:Uncharacterized protein n=1 Tax=Pisum sativum TaxID=3888 RepID=A0A9D5B1X5_PEA|nr:hypothetical protein KIW84_032205 [Pisum sativum]
MFYSPEVPATCHKYPTRANIQLRMEDLKQANCELHEEIFTLRASQERQVGLIDTLMARLELIPTTRLNTTLYAPVVSDTAIPITTIVTTIVTVSFGMSSGFVYLFGHPYGLPHIYQGFIPPPEPTLGFPNGPFGSFGPFGLFGSPPLASQSLASQATVSQGFVPQYYGTNPYGAQLSMSMGNPGYAIPPTTVVTCTLQEDPVDLYHGPSIHSDVCGKKKNGEVFVIVPLFRKPKYFEIFCPSREGTSPASSTKRLDIKMLSPFPYKSDKVMPWEYAPTTTVNGVEQPLVYNKVVTNIADASGLTRSGRVFTPVGLRSRKPDNGKALLVIPERRHVPDVIISLSKQRDNLKWTKEATCARSKMELSKPFPRERLGVKEEVVARALSNETYFRQRIIIHGSQIYGDRGKT